MDLVENLLATEWAVTPHRALEVIDVAPRPVTEVLHHLNRSYGEGLQRAAPELSRAAGLLDALPPGTLLSSAEAADARRSLEILGRHLAYSRLPEAVFLQKRLQSLTGPGEDIAEAMRDFSRQLFNNYQETGATFSLILFTRSAHEGAILKSLQTERADWELAISPEGLRHPDRHLALIPSPEAPEFVEALAHAVGIERRDLPQVVFLGRANSGSLDSYRDLIAASQLAALVRNFSLDPGSYPVQLEAIYRQVYAPGAIAPGTPTAAAGGKLHEVVTSLYKPKQLLKMLLKAFGIVLPTDWLS